MTAPSIHIMLGYFQRGRNRAIRANKEIGVAGLVLVTAAAALAVILLSGGAPPAGADVSGLAASPAPFAGDRFPFEASLSGPALESLSTVSDAAGNFPVFRIDGTGVANEFGEFSFVGTLVQDRSIVPPGCTSGIGSTGIHGSGTIMFPNGMLRVRTSSSRVCIDSADATNGAVVIDFQIVGGTNFFDDAEGQLTFEGMAKRGVFMYTYSGTFSGEILVPPQ